MEEENWDEEEDKKSVKEEVAEVATKTPVKAAGAVAAEAGEGAAGGGDATDKEAREGSAEEGEGEVDDEKEPHTAQRSYIRLICAHCREKSLTFKVYQFYHFPDYCFSSRSHIIFC